MESSFDLQNDQAFMREALRLAAKAREADEFLESVIAFSAWADGRM